MGSYRFQRIACPNNCTFSLVHLVTRSFLALFFARAIKRLRLEVVSDFSLYPRYVPSRFRTTETLLD
jgi:hypothetical protein